MDDNDDLAIPPNLRRTREAPVSLGETVNLAECEVVLKSSNRSAGGVVMKFLVKPEDYTAVMAVLPLNEPMTLKLEKMEVGA